jgi:hypothetical protein
VQGKMSSIPLEAHSCPDAILCACPLNRHSHASLVAQLDFILASQHQTRTSDLQVRTFGGHDLGGMPGTCDPS